MGAEGVNAVAINDRGRPGTGAATGKSTNEPARIGRFPNLFRVLGLEAPKHRLTIGLLEKIDSSAGDNGAAESVPGLELPHHWHFRWQVVH